MLTRHAGRTGGPYHSCAAIGRLVDWRLTTAEARGEAPFSLLSASGDRDPLPPDSCAAVVMLARRPGKAIVSASLNLSHPDASVAAPLHAAWQIAAYSPLSLDLPSEGGLLLALGSSFRVKVKGGPERWPRGGYSFVERWEVGAGEGEGVAVERVAQGGGRTHQVTCQGLGVWVSGGGSDDVYHHGGGGDGGGDGGVTGPDVFPRPQG